MENQKIKKVEGFNQLKQYLKETILEEFEVSVEDYSTLLHYYQVQDKLDQLINREMGWM